MNSHSESKADGPQQTPSRTMKTFFDSRSDYLLESRQTKNSTLIRIKSLEETDSRNNPLRIGRWNPARSRLPLPLQKEIYSRQIRGRRDNSQDTKNYYFNKAFHSRKTTTSRKFRVTIAKFSWPYSWILQLKRPILQC
jgi:hypothetical protein